jgi:L-alanine-DL-glutamate epimerase-like enolase superfamily enzyme
MKIKDIRTETVSIPLKTPFKTALRTVSSVNDIIVKIITDTGHVGYGEAAPAGVITGDTTGATVGAIEDHIRPAIIGHDIEGVV